MILILRSIPTLILALGILFLLLKKEYSIITAILFSFLLLEISPFILNMEGFSFYLFLLSGTIYFVLMHQLYKEFLQPPTIKLLGLFTASFLTVSTLYFFSFNGDDYRMIYHNVLANILFVAYPTLYLTNGIKKDKKYNRFYFNMSCVFLSYFILETILSVMLSFLFKTELIWEIGIRPFRFVVIQVFYVFLIYFGWKLGTLQKS